MKRTGTVLTLAFMLIVGFRNACAAQSSSYEFTKIADSTEFAEFFCCPSLNDTGSVVFAATRTLGDGGGIFVRTGDVTRLVAYNQQDPFSSLFIASRDQSPTINNDGAVVFVASRNTGGNGIFLQDGTTIDTIIDDSGSYNGFIGPIIWNSAEIAFRSWIGPGDSGGTWIFVKGNGGLTPIVSNRSGQFYEVAPPMDVNRTGLVLFRAMLWLDGHTSGGPGVFLGNGGPLTTIAKMYYSDASSPFSSFGDGGCVNEVGSVVFDATRKDGAKGIYKWHTGVTELIADTAGAYSDVVFPCIRAGERVVFMANLDAGGAGLFNGPDEVANRIVATGDELDGGVVQSVVSWRGLNNRGQVAFLARLFDGRVGVFRADPVQNVAIDVRPGQSVNRVMTGVPGLLPVAVLSDTEFDASQVDPRTIRLDGGSVHVSGADRFACNSRDVDQDGDLDLLCLISTAQLQAAPSPVDVVLRARTFAGDAIRGTDTITTIGK